MKSPRLCLGSFATPTVLALTILLGCAPAAQKPAGGGTAGGTDYTYKNGYPTPESSTKALDDADLQRALVAYRFWYPTVSCEGIFSGNRDMGIPANETMAILSAGPRHVVLTPNSDTPYGSTMLDLSNGPWVIELPPGPFIGLVNDHHQGWVLDMGLPGPDAGKGGKHLILPPGYQGKVPAGYHVGRSASNMVLIAVRSLPANGDADAALAALRNIKIHALASPTLLLKFVDATNMDMKASAGPWEDNLMYWQKLNEVVNAEPMVERFGPMYGLLHDLGIGKGQPFQPDERMKGILERAAKMGRAQMMASAFASTRADRFAWPDRKWEWAGLVPNVAEFETLGGTDLEARDRWFIQAIVTSPAMFRRNAGAGSLYWLGCRDATGAYLDGGTTYKLTVPLPVPAKLFWSVTLYDAETRSEVVTDQNKAALRSLFELKNLSGSSVDLYFGPSAPAGQEAHWIKTAPGRGWFTYFRIYGPDQPAFDGSWKPGDFEVVKQR